MGNDQQLLSGQVEFEMCSIYLGVDAKQAVGHLIQVQL